MGGCVGTTRSTYSVVVWKLRTEDKREARSSNAASSSLSRGRQETGRKECLTRRYQAFGFKEEALSDTKENSTLSWERKNGCPGQGRGRGRVFMTHSANGLHFPRDHSFYSHHPGQAPASPGGHAILLPISPSQKSGLHGPLNCVAKWLSFQIWFFFWKLRNSSISLTAKEAK